MNHLVRFKLKMLIVLTFCVFMTFSMLIYLMKITEKCEDSTNELCIQISRNNYVYYKGRENTTTAINQLLKPSLQPPPISSRVPATTAAKPKATSGGYRKQVISSTESSAKGSSPTSQSVRKDRTTNPSVFASREAFGRPAHSFHNRFKFNDTNSFQVYVERQRRIEKFCPKYLDWHHLMKVRKIKLNHILIDEQHKVLYCYVPKVACTNWKRIFLVLTGKASNISEVRNLPASEVHAKNLFKSLQNYSVPEVLNKTVEYTKFIFVRHPFERLLSAYRNKLEQHYDSSKYFQARFGKYIIKKFRKNPTNVSLAKGDDVTFAEFVDYIVSSDPKYYNEHWQRVTDLCHPCLIRYDFIGKYDSLIEDSNFLLRYFGANFSFPLLPKPSTTAPNLKKYYSTLESSAVYKLFKIYEMDFRLFGYDLFNTSDWFDKSR